MTCVSMGDWVMSVLLITGLYPSIARMTHEFHCQEYINFQFTSAL